MGNVNNWTVQKKTIEEAAKNWKSGVYTLVFALKFVRDHKSTWPKAITSFHQIWDHCDMQGFTWQRFNDISAIIADYGQSVVEEIGWEAMSVMFRNRIQDQDDVNQFVGRCRDWIENHRSRPGFGVAWALAREVLPGKVSPPVTPMRARLLQLEALVRELQADNRDLRTRNEALIKICKSKKARVPRYLRVDQAA